MRLLKNLIKIFFCKHDWQPDYSAYGWKDKNDTILPPSFLYLKKCSKCGKIK